MTDFKASAESADRYLSDEGRLQCLARTGLMDSGAEPSYDRLARLASICLATPVALLSLVDADRQYFKSCIGLPDPWSARRETPLSHSFCQHVVVTQQPLVVNDARLDSRVEDNPAITDLCMVAYIGIPLVVDGHVIGSFCAIDSKPRNWTTDDLSTLGDLAESVVTEIRLRAENLENERQRKAVEQALENFQPCLSKIPYAVIVTDVQGHIAFMNPAAEALCGRTNAESIGHPLDAVFRPLDERALPLTNRSAARPSGIELDRAVLTDRLGRPGFSIAATSKRTGISCHALRVWERRYGFPSPTRSLLGLRRYSAEQVAVLEHIAKLARSGRAIGEMISHYQNRGIGL